MVLAIARRGGIIGTMPDFLDSLDSFGFLPEEKGLEPHAKEVDGVVSPKIIASLKRRLNSPKKSERLSAAWELGRLKDPKLVPLLKKALFAEEDKQILAELISAFVHYPEQEAVSALSRFVFQCKDPSLRTKVVWVMSHFTTSKEALDSLKNLLLTDPEPKVRKEAAFALGEIANPQVKDTLREALLSDESAKVRQMVVWALGQIKEAGEEWLIKALHEDSSLQVRREAAWVLGKIKSRKALPELIEALKRESVLAVEEVIVWAIGEIDPKTLAKIQFVLTETYPEKIKAEYIWLLGKHQRKQLLKKFLRLYPGSSLKVKRALIWALVQTKGRLAPRYLRRWYKLEKNKTLKEKILWALNQIGVSR